MRICYEQATSQKNSLPRRPQNHEIHETSSELLILLQQPRNASLNLGRSSSHSCMRICLGGNYRTFFRVWLFLGCINGVQGACGESQ
ncbi:hypothetical protein RvY_13581 [Ramazzottius varieornatus]|uniref:Uncharacterized protein n=1 Tax=Ramazzottius varieornatus TaxID=947166 RepID=A0A1D1VQ63_RAMVA|nr:hypothetical protein RvY_13581 [Ramazzottius varieornatus]